MRQTPAIHHLYIHVPFCPSICPYCDFHVLKRENPLVERYLLQLAKEAETLGERHAFDLKTVYVGGGTPSFLRDSEMSELVDIVRRHLGWGSAENTLEINPGTVSKARGAFWRDLGFDRASVGLQSLDDDTLRFLGRRHSAKQARRSVELLQAAGLRVSGDLITAVRGQPLADDVRGMVELGLEHISAYTLTIESGTEFARRGVQVFAEDEKAGFNTTAELLAQAGFERYEISNYAKDGQRSKHNLAYWHNKFSAALGPSAAAHLPAAPNNGGVLAHRRTAPQLGEWLQMSAAELLDEARAEAVHGPDWVTDALFMGLRLREGVDLVALTASSGVKVEERYAAAIEHGKKRGLLLQNGSRLRATEAGWWVLNEVVREFLLVDAED